VTLEEKVLAVKLMKDFSFFVRYFYKKQYARDFLLVDFHYLIIDALMRVVRGECGRLVINIPPRSGKTELAVKMFVAWCLANSPTAKFIHLSYSDDLALDNSAAIRDIIKSDEYQRLFPSPLRVDSDSKKRWFLAASGGVYATSAGGAITGFGAGSMRRVLTGNSLPADGFGGCVLIDDAIKPDDAFSDTMRDRINRRFNNTIASRTNSPDTPIIVVMQRLHENDMAGFLLNGGSNEHWEHLCIPAIDENGDSIWEERFPIEKLRRMEVADPYSFAGQYMQTPSPLSGGIMRPDNIGIVSAIPHGVEWVRGWDFAASTTGDFTAGAKLGRMLDGRYIIGDMVRVRVSPDERDAALVNTSERDGGSCRISIPQDPGQAGLSQVKYMIRKLSGYSVKSSPETGSKVVRAEALASQINVGNVVMLKADWNDPLVNEMRMFPNGRFDDQVDALSRAFMMLIGNEPSEIFFPETHDSNTRIGADMPGLPSGVVDAVSSRSGDYCGNCTSFVDGACIERGFVVSSTDPGCYAFISTSE